MKDQKQDNIPILLRESSGIARHAEPVTVGVPMPECLIQDIAEMRLFDAQSVCRPLQTQTLAQWPDGSVKWALCDFQADVPANAHAEYVLTVGQEQAEPMPPLMITHESDSFRIETGAAVFTIPIRRFLPFSSVMIDGQECLDATNCRVSLEDDAGRQYEHLIERADIETSGILRTTLKIDGQIRLPNSADGFANFIARLHFYAQSATCRIDYTIHNPNAAQHLNGLWDLGDPGSIYFNNLSLHVATLAQDAHIVWNDDVFGASPRSATEAISIYQDSSGGDNWMSRNHVNRFGKVAHRFQGYRVTQGDAVIAEGKRANPVAALQCDSIRIEGAIRDFWQNFPGALEASANTLVFRLFPAQYDDVFELQGGEQKTQTIFLDFRALPEHRGPEELGVLSLTWIHAPLLAHATPEWYAQSGAFAYLTPSADDPRPDVLALINCAIDGDRSFMNRREQIDEYGWRNFGEQFADHECLHYQGDGLPISHYNNQYDGIYGQLLQFARSGDVRWFRLAHELAHHVIDIDIYHTMQDKPAYNGGLFWHTDHYADAATCTHRTYSKATMLAKNLTFYGGGPSNEHNYATGLMYHYYLTGEIASKDAAVGLADWVIRMDDGALTQWKFLNNRPTGAASKTADENFHGPGRGAGHSISALLDGYQLTKNRAYLEKAEQLIQRCIHPQDDLEKLGLRNPEFRWSYVVFLQILGKYLDMKVLLNEDDACYYYVRDSLLHYADWMRVNEVPITSVFDKVEYPTETWPAQDMRKSAVFFFAAKYAPASQRQGFLDKAEYFFQKSFADLLTFKTCDVTRALVIVMSATPMRAYFYRHPDEAATYKENPYQIGSPRAFKSQLYELKKLRRFAQAVKERLRQR
ncbi:hypothetical protein GobsU_32934 [Candidatus Moduliflexus flocculans]|uniref:Uncharacterized protein n=1 Tax=Candidatus Moduliflexus flocculans TaxID=1499966 RepID=A0A081BM00_9BACT|nr:hypothetical protein GobsU_32934 [Candidatus Moduliflexus flocculans]